jgi:hypothetical protein
LDRVTGNPDWLGAERSKPNQRRLPGRSKVRQKSQVGISQGQEVAFQAEGPWHTHLIEGGVEVGKQTTGRP